MILIIEKIIISPNLSAKEKISGSPIKEIPLFSVKVKV
jgi:hypothetical protein